jgi:hypothetical protein
MSTEIRNIKNKILYNDDDVDNDVETEEREREREEEEYMEELQVYEDDTILIIQEALLHYTEILPLCEYLSLENIEGFVCSKIV